MPEGFGTRLRLRREQHGVDLIAIAEQTKIKLALLEGLERDDVSRWPSGIFRRAYIRAYAQAIGLDADVVVSEFMEVHPDPLELAEKAALEAAAANAQAHPDPRARLRSLVGSALGSLTRTRRTQTMAEQGFEPPGPPRAEPVAAFEPPPAGSPDPDIEADAEPILPSRPAADAQPEFELLLEPEPALVPPSESAPVVVEASRAAVSASAASPSEPAPDLVAFASLCTELGRVESSSELPPLLREAADILEARGLIIWMWDAAAAHLRPALAHGYSEKVLAQLPLVAPHDDNATAAAFRTAHTCAIGGDGDATGALVVPLQTPRGCAGVLAIELPGGHESAPAVRAVATILAASLAQLIGGAELARTEDQREALNAP